MFEKELKIIGYNNNEIIQVEKLLKENLKASIINRTKDNFNVLLSYGYKKAEIKKMSITYITLCITKKENIIKKIEYLKLKDYDIEEIIKITKINPQILGISTKNIENKIIYFEKLGFKNDDIKKVFIKQPSIFIYSITNINKKIINFINLGYKKEDIIKMIINLPSLIGYSTNYINEKFEYLKSLNYTNEEIIKLTSKFSSIYSYSIENIENKRKNFKNKGFSDRNINRMTLNLPSIYGSSITNINPKIKFYSEIGIDFIFQKDTKKLIQSFELSKARYNFFKNNDKKINKENYRDLFMEQNRFENLFGLNNKETIKKYF